MIVYEEASVVYSETSGVEAQCFTDGEDCGQCGGSWGH